MCIITSIDRMSVCALLRANGSSTSCTVGVQDISSYTSTYNQLEIADQVTNPAAVPNGFNTSQLRYQARQLPYVLTEVLNRIEAKMLYNNVLPGRPEPDLGFLNDSIVAPTTTVTATITITDMPTMTPRGGGDDGGGDITVSFSPLTTLVAFLLACVL